MLRTRLITPALALVALTAAPLAHAATGSKLSSVSPTKLAVGGRITIRNAPAISGLPAREVVISSRGRHCRLSATRSAQGTLSLVLTAKKLSCLKAGTSAVTSARVWVEAKRRTELVGRIVITRRVHVPARRATPITATTSSASPTSGSGPGGTPSPTPPGGSGSSLLDWAPPALVNPTTVEVRSGLDPDVLNLSTTQDYILELPPGGIHGTLEINGGHNVVLIGGTITVPSTANQTDNGADDTDTAIYVRDSTGTVHIEGVLITADSDVMFDGIDVNAPEAVVQVENVRMESVYGSYTLEHADMIQTWGGAKELQVDRLTGDGDYQGLTIDPNLGSLGSAQINDVDITDDPRPSALAPETVGGQIMIWLTAGTTTCNSSPVTLSNVYLNNETNRITSNNAVWPATDSGLPCDSVMQGNEITWPGLPVTGGVTLGTPPDGSFVPVGVAGSNYVSPGYQN